MIFVFLHWSEYFRNQKYLLDMPYVYDLSWLFHKAGTTLHTLVWTSPEMYGTDFWIAYYQHESLCYQLPFTEHWLSGRHYKRYFVILLNPYSTPVSWVISFPFYKWENWYAKRKFNMAKVSCYISDRASFQIQVCQG